MATIDNTFLLQTPLSEGGEGFIYDYKNGDILKIYKDMVNKFEKEKKLRLLSSKQLPKHIVISTDLAYDKRKNFIGYIMPKVNAEDLQQLCNKTYCKIHNVTVQDIAKLAISIKNTLTVLHKNNIIISDLNDGNILFDDKYNPFFIDTDSYTIDNILCDVCMPTFKDPLLKANFFTKETDYFAFAILLFKMFSRVHPYGGTTKPDIDILERMNKRISIINNSNVKIPPVARKWDFMSPKILEDFQNIFEKDKRFLIDDSLEDLYKNLKLCPQHKDYYYGKFTNCPVCNANVTVIQIPIKIQGTTGEIPYIILISFSPNDIKIILNENSYIDNNNFVVRNTSKRKIKYVSGNKYYFSEDDENTFIVTDQKVKLLNSKGIFRFDKTNKSPVVFKDDKLYYITDNSYLVCLNVTKFGNSLELITKTSFNAIFDIESDKEYFICNNYQGFKILNISGYNYTLKDHNSKIVNYGIHFDRVTKKWLFIIETVTGNFDTYVFNKNNVEYFNDTIKYAVDLGNLCFSNGIIFRAGDGYIKGFDYAKNVYKDFPCKAVNDGAKLIRKNNKFVVINEKEIIQVG